MFRLIDGVDKFIVMFGAVTAGGVSGSCGFGTLIVTGFSLGNVSTGASRGVLTFRLIEGLTTSLGISICGVIVISSFKMDFGRTFAII